MSAADWITHDGKSQPVSDDTRVRIRSREGTELDGPASMFSSGWDHWHPNVAYKYHVVAYKVLEPVADQKEGGE